MRLVKERQFLSFYFEEDKKVQYNLATGEYIGISGSIVKNLNSQLCGYSIQEVIDSCEQEGYRNYLNKVYDLTSKARFFDGNRKYSNIGTFLKHVSENRFLEQYYILGLEPDYKFAMRYNLKDLPKGFVSKVRDGILKLQDSDLSIYKNFKDYVEIYTKNKNSFNSLVEKDVIGGGSYRLQRIKTLVENYNYKISSLFKYIDNIKTYEGLDPYDVLTNLEDYIKMNDRMQAKFEKYPRYLLTTHQITVKNFNRFKSIIDEKKFLEHKKDYLAWEYEDYKFIVPQKSSDIKDEACQMNNCVASYIDRVCEGTTNIIFMRKKDKKDKSLVTVEVKMLNDVYRPVQYFQSNNRQCTREQMDVINKYKEHLERIKEKLLTQQIEYDKI